MSGTWESMMRNVIDLAERNAYRNGFEAARAAAAQLAQLEADYYREDDEGRCLLLELLSERIEALKPEASQ